MKVFIHFATLLTTFALLVLSCEERPGKEGTVTIHGELEILLPPTQKDTSISFTATAAWTAMAEDAQWLSIEPDGGAAGEITAKISVQANPDTDSRTATVKILCGTSETSLTVKQDGNGTDTPADDPDIQTGKLIKTLFISNGIDDSYEFRFTYDENSLLTKIETNEKFVSGGGENISYDSQYVLDYSDEKIVISGQEEDYSISLEAVLDDQGRAISAVYTDIGENGYGEIEENRTYVRFSYDKEGKLTAEAGKEDGYDEYNNEYIWSEGNLTCMESGYSRYEFTYSDHPDNSNIDINWIICDGYGSGANMLGVIGVLGKRSDNFVWPDLWDYNTPNDNLGVDYPLDSELIGEETVREYTEYRSGEPEVKYSFDPEGDLTSIIKTVPRYRTTYRQVFRYELEDPNLPPYEDGYYHEGVILVPVGDPETKSTETLESRITEVEIGY